MKKTSKLTSFLLTTLGDIFLCEDKPTDATEADAQADIKKAKELREKRLLYI